MNDIFATILTALMLALPISQLPAGPAAAQDGGCVSARQAQRAVEAGEILELPDAARRAGVDRKYIDSQAQLCDVNGSPHWIVNMMDDVGGSERVVLKARDD